MSSSNFDPCAGGEQLRVNHATATHREVFYTEMTRRVSRIHQLNCMRQELGVTPEQLTRLHAQLIF